MCKAIPFLLGENSSPLCRAKVILENQLNFLSTIMHYEFFVNQNSHCMEGLPCAWGRAEHKIGSVSSPELFRSFLSLSRPPFGPLFMVK